MNVNPQWKTYRTKRRGPVKDIGLSTARAEVLRRSGGRCEVVTASCTTWSTCVHHRQKRGGIWVHDVERMISACDCCHNMSDDSIHSNEGWSYRHGLLLRTGIEPFLVTGCPRTCELDHTPGETAMPATGVLFTRRRK